MKSRVQVREDIQLGSNGSKWKHGWIPLNAVAAAIKAKKFGKEGHSGKSRIDVAKQITHATAPSGKTRAPRGSKIVAKGPRGNAVVIAQTRHIDATKLPGPKTPLPEGRKVTAHEVGGTIGEIRDAENGRILSSGHKSKRAAAVIANRHNLKTEQDAVAKDNAISKSVKLSIRPQTHLGQPGFGVAGKDRDGKSVRVWAPTRAQAERAVLNIKAGKPAFGE